MTTATEIRNQAQQVVSSMSDDEIREAAIRVIQDRDTMDAEVMKWIIGEAMKRGMINV